MTIMDVARYKPLNREIEIPSENILTHTFIPVGPSQVFRSWLMPVASVRMAMLLHPSAVAVDSLVIGFWSSLPPHQSPKRSYALGRVGCHRIGMVFG